MEGKYRRQTVWRTEQDTLIIESQISTANPYPYFDAGRESSEQISSHNILELKIEIRNLLGRQLQYQCS